MCRIYGFEKEITQRYNDSNALTNFINVFNHMPIAAIIEQELFRTRGGISKVLLEPDATDLRVAISEIRRPVDVPSNGLMCSLLWSDPIPTSDPHRSVGKGVRGDAATGLVTM